MWNTFEALKVGGFGEVEKPAFILAQQERDTTGFLRQDNNRIIDNRKSTKTWVRNIIIKTHRDESWI